MNENIETVNSTVSLDSEWLPDRSKSYIIFAFTGQGQQHPDMLMPWYGYSKETDITLEHFHNVTNTPIGEPLDSSELERGPLMQPANVTLGVIGNMALVSAGIKPNETFGHSLGEYPALSSAGFVKANDIITLARHRGESTDKNIRELAKQKIPTGMMVAFNATGEVASKVHEFLSELGIPKSDLDISNFNSDDQVVLSGLSKYFSIFKEHAKRFKVITKELNVDGAYHSLHMKVARTALQPYIDELPISEPKNPKLYSPTTVSRIKTRKDVAVMLRDQLVSPVQYAQLINSRLDYVNSRHISNLLRANNAEEIVVIEVGAYPPGKQSDKGVLVGITEKNIRTYQRNSKPIRFHRVSEPEDIFHSRLTKTD